MNWKSLVALHSLYGNLQVDKYLISQSYGNSLISAGLLENSSDGVTKSSNFDKFYEQKWLRLYEDLNTFLTKFGISHTNFDITSIRALQKIEIDKADLLDNESSLKEISTNYFESAKKIKEGSQLYKAILEILEIDTLKKDEHDQQYLMILHSQNKNPKAIILCENDNLLRKPRLSEIELWHAGGNNTAKLEYIVEPKLPFFYLCDWDNKGIEIYQRIKKNIYPNIELIIPEKLLLKNIKENSEWKVKIDETLFHNNAILIINKLRQEKKWIEEESINFLSQLKSDF